MDWNEFKMLYSSCFRPLTERDGLEKWQSFAAQIAENEEPLVLKAVAALGKIHAEKRMAGADPLAPRIPDIVFMMNRERDELRRSGASSRGNCPLCKGTRHLISAEVYSCYKKQFPFPEAFEKIPRKAFCGFVVWDCPDCARSYRSQELADALRRNAVSDSVPTMELSERIGKNPVELASFELPKQVASALREL